jgi:hypothetical protein
MKKVINTDIINESTSGEGVTVGGVLLKDGKITSSSLDELAFQTPVFADPLVLDAITNKDFICSDVSGNTTVNLTNTSNGDAGMIELIITGAGGYTVALGTMFTKDISGTAIDTTTGKDNIISWRKAGTDIIYSISQVQ